MLFLIRLCSPNVCALWFDCVSAWTGSKSSVGKTAAEAELALIDRSAQSLRLSVRPSARCSTWLDDIALVRPLHSCGATGRHCELPLRLPHCAAPEKANGRCDQPSNGRPTATAAARAAARLRTPTQRLRCSGVRACTSAHIRFEWRLTAHAHAARCCVCVCAHCSVRFPSRWFPFASLDH